MTVHTLTDPIGGVRFVLVQGVKVAKFAPCEDGEILIAPCLPDGRPIALPDVILDTHEAIAAWMAIDLCDPDHP